MTPPRVVRTPDVMGGQPRLDGYRLTTDFFWRNYHDPDGGRAWIKQGWPYLTDADIDCALAYERRPIRRLRRAALAVRSWACRRLCDPWECGE